MTQRIAEERTEAEYEEVLRGFRERFQPTHFDKLKKLLDEMGVEHFAQEGVAPRGEKAIGLPHPHQRWLTIAFLFNPDGSFKLWQ
jgi:hypothetical protein